MADAGGLLLKSDDGSLYFIRDEVLAACKVEGEYLEAVEAAANESEVEGFAFSARPQRFNQVNNFSSPNLDLKASQLGVPNLAGKVSSEGTIMCPW